MAKKEHDTRSANVAESGPVVTQSRERKAL